jgi:eukaryotic-like serine/threonine-protein kinase
VSPDLREQLQRALVGAYTLERELGGGGMSRIFVATENRLGRTVVVKVLSPELAASVSVDRFEREIRFAASLQQANIVPLLATGEMNGMPYYTMPFVEGESLRARLARSGALPVAECVGILHDVTRALSYAHARGVVHRDIKPDNVLLSHGTAVVTDFGIAKAISAARTSDGSSTLTDVGASVGTPSYMAPEQVAGDENVDHRADLYALGCMAYELLTGRPPFAGLTPQRILGAHLGAKPRAVSELRPDTPRPLAAIVMRCLEKDPERRPADAGEVARALDESVGASGAPTRGAFWSRVSPTGRVALAAVAVAALTMSGVAIWRARAGVAPADRSVAILPLANLSGDKANDYFGEGLAEEITDALSKAGVLVIGRSSAVALAARGTDARDIARQLGVGSLLQGSVQRAGDNVRVTVQLISARNGATIWSDTYDKQLKDVFAVQDQIAHSVAAELRVTLTGGARAPLARTETSDPEAHALYLQGLYLWNRRTAQTLRQAITLFEQAAARDPRYARAYAGEALAYVQLPAYDDVPNDAYYEKAREAASRALGIDSTLAEAYAALGAADGYQFRNADAEREFTRAIGADSGFATAHFWHGWVLNHAGRYAEALREMERARQLEPASLVVNTVGGLLLFQQDRIASADSALRRVLALDPSFVLASSGLPRVLIEEGKYDEAIARLEQLVALPAIRRAENMALLTYAYARSARTREARHTIARMIDESGRPLALSGSLAVAYDALGERALALAALRSAIQQHDPWLTLQGRSPAYAHLRADPVAAGMLARIEAP